MRKKYHIKSPELLDGLTDFIKEGNVSALISVWRSKLRKDGESPWDHSIFAVFDTKDGRHAYIAREVSGELLVRANLKYVPALKWCEDNLKMAN